MKILVIQNCATENIGLYEQYLLRNKIVYRVLHAYKSRKFPPSNEYDAFIVAGTPISVNELHEHNFLLKEWIYLKKVVLMNKPYLGICFGGQLLARILGTNVRKNKVMEIGGYDVQLTSYGKKDAVFKGFPQKFPVFQWHTDTFGIPKSARGLVRGKLCKNQAFRYKNAIALQFHLEVKAKDVSRWARRYAGELTIVNKTRSQVVRECKIREKAMKKLAYQFLDNFFNLVSKY
jgi:GMP synthase-like glutamine amidotransferase